MKKKILSGLFALVLLATAGFGMYKSMNGNANLNDLALANVEALAQGEDGTNVGYCYMEQSFSSNNGWKKFCDSRTNDNTIYPCPSNDKLSGYSESYKDRCTK
jgi:uncharacterized protein YxeA